MGRFQLELIYYYYLFFHRRRSQETQESSTPYKTCWKCRIDDEKPTGKKNTTAEWDDGGKIGFNNKWSLPLKSSKLINTQKDDEIWLGREYLFTSVSKDVLF